MKAVPRLRLLSAMAGHANPPSPAANGRASNGRFVAGNKCGKGNPFNRKVASLRSALLESATPEKVRAVANRLYQSALTGDVAAAKLYFAYTIGKPQDFADPDRADLHEWQLVNAYPTVPQLLRVLMDSIPPAALLDLLRDSLPQDGDAALAKAQAAVDDSDPDSIAPHRTADAVAAERQARIGG